MLTLPYLTLLPLAGQTSTEFMAYMDGKSEKDIIWCPGVVCSRQSGGESGGAPVSSEAEAEGGLVVDVMGQAQAEFPVTEDNLTGFPGFHENLETVRHAVEEGLVSIVHTTYVQFFGKLSENQKTGAGPPPHEVEIL